MTHKSLGGIHKYGQRGGMPRRNRVADVIMQVARGTKRQREPDYLRPDEPPRQYLRGAGGYGASTNFGQRVYRAFSSGVRAGQDLLGQIADAAREPAREMFDAGVPAIFNAGFRQGVGMLMAAGAARGVHRAIQN